MCTKELPLPKDTEAPGVVYGDFAIRNLLVSRSNETDFVADQLSLDRNVVLKLIKRELSTNRQFADSFLDVALTAAGLEHPFVSPIYGAGEEDDICYLARGIGGGTTLKEHLLKHGTLSWQDGSRLACDIADGLDYAWQRAKLTHMNVKPDYIMLCSRGHGQIADIGIAGLNPDPQSERIIGTPQYISPERIVGMDGDNRSDIYSLGVTFYFMITGVFPFNAKNTNDIVTKHLQEFPRPANQIVPDIPPQLCSIIDMMLDNNPNLRYQNGSMLIEDLHSVLHGDMPEHALKSGNITPTSPGSSHGHPAVVPMGMSASHRNIAPPGSPNESAGGGTMKVRVEGKDKVKVLQLAGPNQGSPSGSGSFTPPPPSPQPAAEPVAQPVPNAAQSEPDELDLLLEDFGDDIGGTGKHIALDDDVLETDLDELLSDGEPMPPQVPVATPPVATPSQAPPPPSNDAPIAPPPVRRSPTAKPVVLIDDDEDDDVPEFQELRKPPLAPPPVPVRRPTTHPVVQIDDDDFADAPKVTPKETPPRRKTRTAAGLTKKKKKKFKTRVGMKRKDR